MIYRQGRHRPRNVYAQHGPKPADDDVFVALFDDPYDAADYCWLKNGQGHTAQVIDRSPMGHGLTRCAGCGHAQLDHVHGGAGRCDRGHCPCGVFQEPIVGVESPDNPFCQRDGCVHHRAQHSFGVGFCRACPCHEFVEVET